MTSKFFSLAIVSTAGIILASPTFAGEVNGKGDSTPIRNFIAAICSFSGLEDGDPMHPDAPSGPGVTQTPHSVEGTFPPPGAAAAHWHTSEHFPSGRLGLAARLSAGTRPRRERS